MFRSNTEHIPITAMIAQSSDPDHVLRVTDALKLRSAAGLILQPIPTAGGTRVRCTMERREARKLIRAWTRGELGPAFALNLVTDLREERDEIQAIIRVGGFPNRGQIVVLRKDLRDHQISIEREQITSFRLTLRRPGNNDEPDSLEDIAGHMLLSGTPSDIRWLGERIALNNVPEVEGHSPIPRFHDNLHPHFVPIHSPVHAEPPPCPENQHDQLWVEGSGDEAGLLCSFHSGLQKLIELEYTDGAVLEDLDGSRPWRIVLRWAPMPGHQRAQVNAAVLKIIDDWFARTGRSGRRILTVKWIPAGIP